MANIVLGAIYKHPSIKHYKFNNKYLNVLFNEIECRNKKCNLTDFFNVNLINCKQTKGVHEFLETLLS